jgi:nicotinic acid mononucleotide adenylyltransferase
VATRPGYPRDRLEAVRTQLARPDRVRYFDLDPIDVASRDVRARVAAGRPVDRLVPPAVLRLIHELGLYRAP